jgi:hypothetical protein
MNPERRVLESRIAVLKLRTRKAKREGAIGRNTRFRNRLKNAILQVIGIHLTLVKWDAVFVERSGNNPIVRYGIGHYGSFEIFLAHLYLFFHSLNNLSLNHSP